MSEDRDYWDSIPSPIHPSMSTPRSRQSWPASEPGNVQLARLQEASHYQALASEATTRRLQTVTERMQGVDQRLRSIEQWRPEVVRVLTQILPILQRYERMQMWWRGALATLRYAGAAAAVYMAATGRLEWGDVLRVLAKISGAG